MMSYLMRNPCLDTSPDLGLVNLGRVVILRTITQLCLGVRSIIRYKRQTAKKPTTSPTVLIFTIELLDLKLIGLILMFTI